MTAPSGARILVVEDDALVRENVCDYLREVGFDPVAATNADDAQRLLSSDVTIRLVLTDITMPGRIDGESLADWIASERPSMPVIVTSARRPLRRAQNLRFQFIAKPYALPDLELVIHQLLS